MKTLCRVLIIGDSLFTETLTTMLVESEHVHLVGSAPAILQGLPMIEFHNPDVIIVVETGTADPVNLDHLLTSHPELPIIRANPNDTFVQIITSRRIQARRHDLMAVIQSLTPKTE